MFTAVLRILFFIFGVKPLVHGFLGMNIFGRKRLPIQEKYKQCIIIANHNSHLDTILLLNLFPLKYLHLIRPVAAADYFLSNRLLGWFSTTFLNILPIPRNHFGKHNHPIILMGKALERGESLILFPEGTRGEPETMVQFQTGIAHMVSRYPKVPIVPIFIRGAGKSLPKGEFLLVPFFCDVVIGEPRYFDPVTLEHRSSAKIKQAITQQLEKAVLDLEGEFHRMLEVSPPPNSPEKGAPPMEFLFAEGLSTDSLDIQTVSRSFQQIQQWVETRGALAGLLLWSFLEAWIWVILPDFLLFLFVVVVPSKKWVYCRYALLASLMGTLLMIGFCWHFQSWVDRYLFTLPFTHKGMIERLHHLTENIGIVGSLFQAVSAVPIKVWTYAAMTQFHWNPLVFFILTGLSRAIRMSLVVLLAAWIGKHCPARLKEYWPFWLLAYTTIFLWLLAISANLQ